MAIFNSLTADKAYTVKDFIDLSGSDEVTYYNYCISEFKDGYELFITNLLYDYEQEFQDAAVYIEFTDAEKIKYRYKPELLAYDIYGSTEMAFILMMLNGIIDPKDFTFDKVKAIKKTTLDDMLGKIDSVNDKYMNNIKAKLKEDIKQGDETTVW